VIDMKIHFPFFDYSWLKLWVLLMVAIQINESVHFMLKVVVPVKKSNAQSVFDYHMKYSKIYQRTIRGGVK